MPSRQHRRRLRGAGADGGPGGEGVRGRDTGNGLRLRVDRVVVEGLSRTEGEALGRAVERELVTRFGDRRVDIAPPRTIEHIDAGDVRLKQVRGAETVAARLAAAIDERIDR